MAGARVPENFGALLCETARAWRQHLDQRLKPLGLSQARWLVLLKLARDGDGMVQKKLAGRVGIEGATLVGLLDRMARDGWIVRRDSEHDRRSKNVYLTERARSVLPRIEAVAAELRRELLAGIPARDLERCTRVLLHIKERIEGV